MMAREIYTDLVLMQARHLWSSGRFEFLSLNQSRDTSHGKLSQKKLPLRICDPSRAGADAVFRTLALPVCLSFY